MYRADRMADNLPLLEPFTKQHTYCAYCPKMCRFSCPVSVAQSSETTTPWAKMTSAHHVNDGNLDMSETVAASWYGCSGCLRCRTHCTHRNEVAATLYAARAEAIQQGRAPTRAVAVLQEHKRRERNAALAASRLYTSSATDAQPDVMYFPGCTANVLCADESVAGWRATRALADAPVQVVADRCCGLPLLEAGDPNGFRRAATEALLAISTARLVVFLDPGCLHALKIESVRHGLTPPADRMIHLSELAAQHIDRIEPLPKPMTARYHDPCRLGRGLGVYEAPRRVLAKILASEVEEFHQCRHDSICSGGGGQLPRTDPQTAAAIAKNRVAQHAWVGGGNIVTACPGSARQLSKNGNDPVLSFASLLEESCREDR
ncbi:MAG: (Fe-S)-binding protein [Myxococcales bacterium]|nr:(Fe-S)-binding protein [Myxococcales bacterium]MDH3483560.1 (Fe-S)-binding protein [Myxococcales bacterium]